MPRGHTFADLLGRGGARRFVGRQAEQDLFRRILGGDQTRLLWVHGPGGVGKTSLLGAFGRIAADMAVPCVHVDLMTTEPRPDAFSVELASQGWSQDADETARLVTVDTFERAGPLEAWLRDHWLPTLSAASVVVLAGRRGPAGAWRAEGWRALTQEIRLRNLTPGETQAYLATSGIAEADRASLAALTHGHPLALSLAADLVRHRSSAPLGRLEDAPDLVGTLVQRMVDAVPSPAHRRALQLSAHAWMTTEDLLRDVLEADDTSELMAWLRSLSLVEEGPYGVFPHDLARDVIDADLHWCDPSGYADLHRRIQRASIARARALTGADQQRAIMHIVYGHRHSSATAAFWDYEQLGSVYADALRPADVPALVAMTHRHQGPEQAALVARWAERQPAAFHVVRGGEPDPVGFAAVIRLDLADESDRQQDPAVAAAWRAIEQSQPLRAGDHATMIRFLVDAERNQAPSRTLNLGPVLTFQTLIADPAAAWDVLCFIDSGGIDPLMEFIDYRRLAAADHRVGQTGYAVFGRDFRGGALNGWMDLLADRELGEPVAPAGGHADEVLALSYVEFADSVRQALKDLVRPERLASSPLCRSRLVCGRDDAADPAVRLASLVRSAVAELSEHPREEPLGRAVDRTYLRPAATQEAAAEVLGLPFSTYRRHLTKGVERVVEKLWRLEVTDPGPEMDRK